MTKVSDWLYSFKTQQLNSLREDIDISRQFLPRSVRNTKLIAVTAGKGGVGKTTISLKMSKELVAQGFKVLLIDCDCNLANTQIKLGIPINNLFYDLVTSEKDFDDCVYKDGDFHLLYGCNGNINLLNSKLELDKFIIEIVNDHKKNYDFVILDCPAGISREVLNLNYYCDFRFVVITPDKSSITDSYSLMKILKLEYGVSENHLIVNRYLFPRQFQRVIKSMVTTTKNFLEINCHVLGGVREYDNKLDSLDNVLFTNKTSQINENFFKVAKIFTERFCKGIFTSERKSGVFQDLFHTS